MIMIYISNSPKANNINNNFLIQILLLIKEVNDKNSHLLVIIICKKNINNMNLILNLLVLVNNSYMNIITKKNINNLKIKITHLNNLAFNHRLDKYYNIHNY